jgi:hypothetical protein
MAGMSAVNSDKPTGAAAGRAGTSRARTSGGSRVSDRDGAGVPVPVQRVPVLRVPVLRSPFPSRRNRHDEAAERRALRWAVRIGLATPGEAALLQRQRFGLLAGRCHPDAGLPGLVDICRWYVWFAVLDDRYCDRPPAGTDTEWLAQRLGEVGRALDEPDAPGEEPVARAAADLARRIRTRATDEQHRRLVLSFQATFFGLLWESAARRLNAHPPVPNFTWMRRYTGSLPAFVTLTEVYGGRPPTPQEVARREVRTLVARAGNLIMWQNDIRSYRAEVAAGRPVLSLPTVLAHERGLPPGRAVALAARMWRAEVEEYRRAREAVLALASPALRRYADHLHDLLAGFLTWHYETARYS